MTFARLVAGAGAVISAVLLFDGPGLAYQLLLGTVTAVYVWLFCRRLAIPLGQVLCCIVIATTGEVVLSIGWGLYTYEHALIPLYVPPGHGLFYALAIATARQSWLQRHEATIARAVLVIGTLLALASLAAFRDVWGMLWWIAAFLLLRASRNRLMLSACFVYTLLLEWGGTANGNWRWAAEVPYLGLTSANPPSGVGILYIVLDLIVVALVERRPLRPPLPSPSAAEAAAAPLDA